MPPSVPPRRPPPAPPVHGKPRTERGYPASLSAWGPKGRGPSRLSSSPPHPPPPHPDSHPAFCAGRAERAGARGAVAAGEGVGLHVAAAAWPLRAKRLDRTRAFGLGV